MDNDEQAAEEGLVDTDPEPPRPSREVENPWRVVRLFDPEMVVGVRVGQKSQAPPFVALWLRDREGIGGASDMEAWVDADEARLIAQLLLSAADEIDPEPLF